jgi:hypothetical protein
VSVIVGSARVCVSAELTSPLPCPLVLAARCNKHLLGLGQRVKKSIQDAGIIGYQFGTVGVSDGISMGTFGMSYSVSSYASASLAEPSPASVAQTECSSVPHALFLPTCSCNPEI